MRQFLVVLLVLFIMPLHATTVNINWTVDGDTYAQTSCETGGNFTLPTTPTKYGYHFVGWQQDGSIGAWTQSGTPTPDNPIEPTFRQFGNTVLRAVGSGNNLIADSYDVSTGKITRRIGVKVLDGTEGWTVADDGYIKSDASNAFCSYGDALYQDNSKSVGLSNQLVVAPTYIWSTKGKPNTFTWNGRQLHINIANNLLGITDYKQETTSSVSKKIKKFLADQYANGTPVIIYYPLATPVEEAYNAQ